VEAVGANQRKERQAVEIEQPEKSEADEIA